MNTVDDIICRGRCKTLFNISHTHTLFFVWFNVLVAGKDPRSKQESTSTASSTSDVPNQGSGSPKALVEQPKIDMAAMIATVSSLTKLGEGEQLANLKTLFPNVGDAELADAYRQALDLQKQKERDGVIQSIVSTFDYGDSDDEGADTKTQKSVSSR